jgi:hypothetical protein
MSYRSERVVYALGLLCRLGVRSTNPERRFDTRSRPIAACAVDTKQRNDDQRIPKGRSLVAVSRHHPNRVSSPLAARLGNVREAHRVDLVTGWGQMSWMVAMAGARVLRAVCLI